MTHLNPSSKLATTVGTLLNEMPRASTIVTSDEKVSRQVKLMSFRRRNEGFTRMGRGECHKSQFQVVVPSPWLSHKMHPMEVYHLDGDHLTHEDWLDSKNC